MSKTIQNRIATLRRLEAEIELADQMIANAKAINARIVAAGGWKKHAREWKARQLSEANAKP